MYGDAQAIYLASVSGVYRLERSSLCALHTVKKRIAVSGWNKEDAPGSAAYRSCKLQVDHGKVYGKPYYILEYTQNGEHWGVYFMKYDLPTVTAVTGLSVEE